MFELHKHIFTSSLHMSTLYSDMSQIKSASINKKYHDITTGFSSAGFDSNHAHWAGDRKPLAPGATHQVAPPAQPAAQPAAPVPAKSRRRGQGSDGH